MKLSPGSRIAPQDEDILLEALKEPTRAGIRNFITETIHKYELKPPFVDIACGYRTSQPEVVASLGKVDYYSFDIADLHLYKEREGASQNLIADALNVPIQTNWAGTILCLEALEHMQDDKGVISEARRVLKKGGFLVLTIPGIDFPRHEKDYQVDYGRDSSNALSEILKGCNFEITSLEERFYKGRHASTFVIAQ